MARTGLVVTLASLAVASANAQLVAEVTWRDAGEACPAFLRAAPEVTVVRVAGGEIVGIGHVEFGKGLPAGKRTFSLEAPPFAMEGWTFRLTSPGCSASASTRHFREMNAEEGRAFATRTATLRDAEAQLARMEEAASARDYATALSASKQACELRRSALGASHPLVAECEIAQARMSTFDGKAQEALDLTDRAISSLSAGSEVAGRLAVYAAHLIRARAFFQLSRPFEMRQAAEMAYAGRLRLLGADHADTLASQESVAIALKTLGRIDEAIAVQELLLLQYTATQGAAGSDTIRTKGNLASTLQQRGDYDRVVSLQRDVFEARTLANGDTDAATLVAALDYCVALSDAGRIDEALPIMARSMPRFLDRFGPEHLQTLRIKTLLGSTYERMGRSEEALPLFFDVYATRRRLLGDSHASTISAAHNLADVYLALDHPAEALAIADAALSRMPADAGRIPALEEGLLISKAEAQLRIGDAPRSLETAERALGGRKPAFEQVRLASRRQIDAASQWAQATFAVGARADAIEAMDAIYRACRERFGPDHPVTLEAMGGLARMLAMADQNDEAQRLLAEFVEIGERQLRMGVAANTANQGRLAQVVRDRPYSAGYRTYVRLLAARDPVRAFEVAELTKARSLSEVLARPEAEGSEVKAARIRLARADERMTEAEIGSPLYLRAVAERTRAEDELRALPAVAQRRFQAADVRETLRRVLPSGSVFIQFVVSGDNVVAMTSTSQARIQAKDLGQIPGLADTIEAFRRTLISTDPSSERLWLLADGSVRWSLAQPEGSVRVRDIESVGRRLSERLLDPLMPQIAGVRTWLISPDGALAFLPFEALRIGRQSVLETRNVVYAPSLSSLSRMPARVETGPRWDFLGVGVSSFARAAGSWRDLPQAEAEVASIGQVFGVTRILAGAEATEKRLRELDTAGELRRYRYVHFATHAFLSSRGTNLSGVVMSDAGAPNGDGVITAAEWPTYRLGSDLVVLSACDTGLGKLVVGEGVVGLPSAMLSAGTRAVVLTLWSVADESAADFMPRFYKRLKAGKSPAEALRETKLEFARSKGPYSSPRHWAPYVLYGAS